MEKQIKRKEMEKKKKTKKNTKKRQSGEEKECKNNAKIKKDLKNIITLEVSKIR